MTLRFLHTRLLVRGVPCVMRDTDLVITSTDRKAMQAAKVFARLAGKQLVTIDELAARKRVLS